MEIQGIIIVKGEVEQISDSFRKREFVLEYAENPQYPELIKFELIQDNVDILDNVGVGDELSVAFNLRGRKWTNPQGEDKYFNSLLAWKINVVKDADPGGTPDAPVSNVENWKESESKGKIFEDAGSNDGDDLPF